MKMKMMKMITRKMRMKIKTSIMYSTIPNIHITNNFNNTLFVFVIYLFVTQNIL